MKEIFYVQAGTTSNYIGTHFWNSQESYLTLGNECEDSGPFSVNHSRSFREGENDKDTVTLNPRVLIFDNKNNFGSLLRSNALKDAYNAADEEAAVNEALGAWQGSVVESHQDLLPPSKYQEFLDQEDDIDPAPMHNYSEEASDLNRPSAQDIRFWSDFNRVFYTSRSFQRLPYQPDWESLEANWSSGKEIFSRYDEDESLMEGSVRLFIEECDNFQGVQVLADGSTFGAFIDSFLTAFRDEYTKATSLSFPILSNHVLSLSEISRDDEYAMRKALSDALLLRNLQDLSSSSQVVPIQSPGRWSPLSHRWLNIDEGNIYHTSAILSAHIESSTLPLRFKRGGEELSSLCARLNWRGNTHFSSLRGVIPASILFQNESEAAVDESFIVDYTHLGDFKDSKALGSPMSRYDVLRGFLDPMRAKLYDVWSEKSGLREPFSFTTQAGNYPLPSSFPSIISPNDLFLPPRKSSKPSISYPYQVPSVALWSSLETTSTTAKILTEYASIVKECVLRNKNYGLGAERDELKELENDLWNLRDAYADEEADDDIKNDNDQDDDL